MHADWIFIIESESDNITTKFSISAKVNKDMSRGLSGGAEDNNLKGAKSVSSFVVGII